MKSLKKLRADAQKARQKLAKLEAEFKVWQGQPHAPEELDAWIILLGDARHDEAAATKAVVASTPKSEQ
jgi:DNA-binding protein H-NS